MASPSGRLVAAALAFAVTSLPLAARAHGSRLVPIEDKPVTDAEAPGTTPPAPPPLRTQAPSYDWAGLRVGGHFGYGRGISHSLATGAGASAFGSLFGGLHLGYDYVLPSHVVVGVEGDIAFPYFADDGVLASGGAAQGGVTEKADFVSTARGRVGYALQSWLPYVTGGFAWSQTRLHATSDTSAPDVLRIRAGWTAGAGSEFALGPAWSLTLEYRFQHLDSAPATLAANANYQAAATDDHGVLLGLTWRFDPSRSASRDPTADDAHSAVRGEDWNVHGQVTFIEQGYFRFHSPYEGANSLSGATQFKNTVSTTAFLGLRLWNGAEVYLNPEIDQGFGLSQTLGVASFPNGEAQKASYVVPRFNVDRVFLRQTLGLGGDRTRVEDGPNHLASDYDVSRITVTVGRLSVGDLFLQNAYASDPRTQFLNWNVYGGGSYDWTMDRPGWTWGAIVELNQARWALRAGYFLEPTVSNGNTFDLQIPTHGQYVVEPELRYSLLSRPARLRLFGWLTRANMGSYEDALAMTPTVAGYPDISQTRRVRTTYGVVANLEQAITDDLGVFSRVSWTPGLVEVMGWTDCDESAALGAALRGTAWRRPRDTVGVAGVVEGLSPEARAYFAAGGMGILIGDGKLNYRPEQVLEAYYAFNAFAWGGLTLDYQFIGNPGYNADRGPVSVYAARLHVEL